MLRKKMTKEKFLFSVRDTLQLLWWQFVVYEWHFLYVVKSVKTIILVLFRFLLKKESHFGFCSAKTKIGNKTWTVIFVKLVKNVVLYHLITADGKEKSFLDSTYNVDLELESLNIDS